MVGDSRNVAVIVTLHFAAAVAVTVDVAVAVAVAEPYKALIKHIKKLPWQTGCLPDLLPARLTAYTFWTLLLLLLMLLLGVVSLAVAVAFAFAVVSL